MNTTEFTERISLLRQRTTQLGAISGVVLLAGLLLVPERAWPALLTASFGLLCLGLGGQVFVAVQYASGAVWSIALRRVGEAMAAAIAPGAAGILAVVLFRPSIYAWTAHLEIEHGGWAGFKLAWLSYPFFLARALVYIAAWIAFSRAMRSLSRLQDTDDSPELGRRSTRLAVCFLIVFGFSYWLASTDWIMSLEPMWTSTIFGIYNFSGLFSSALAALTLLTLWLRQGPLRGSIGESHLHDLGQMLLAFSTFWAYIWFSQAMLIWYANLPEETPHVILRTSAGWGYPFYWNVVLNWVLPFLLLLPRANKVNPRTLGLAAMLVLAGRLVDLYLAVVPPFSPASAWPAVWDVAAMTLAGALFLRVALQRFAQAEALPIGDERLQESLHMHS